MIEPKEKRCSGTGLAKGYGCGKMTKYRVHGLCTKDCYPEWLMNSENGKLKMQRAMLKVSKPRMDLEAAKEERDERRKISNYLQSAKDSCHAFIRERDKGLNCVSCGNPWHEDFQAGHLYKAELFSTLKFDEKNISGQCRRCNLFNDGNESGYRVGIINRYGVDHLNYLDEKAAIEKQINHKWERHELQKIRIDYIQKLRECLKSK